MASEFEYGQMEVSMMGYLKKVYQMVTVSINGGTVLYTKAKYIKVRLKAQEYIQMQRTASYSKDQIGGRIKF
jgi:hypothetical protein